MTIQQALDQKVWAVIGATSAPRGWLAALKNWPAWMAVVPSPCLTLTHHQQSVRNTSVIVSPLVSKSLSSFGLVFLVSPFMMLGRRIKC